MIEKFRAYLTTGSLYTCVESNDATTEHRDHVILWVRNYGEMFRWDEAQPDYGFQIEFGSSRTEGGRIRFDYKSSTRSTLSESLSSGIPRQFNGEGFLDTPESRYPDKVGYTKPDHLRLTTSFVDVSDQTGVDLELAPSDPKGGGIITLTDAQREDLAAFLDAGQLDDLEIKGTPTELVLPDGRVKSVDTDELGECPDNFSDL